MTNISQNGPGGVCVKQWCKKENESDLGQRGCLQPPDSLPNKKMCASCYLMIPGLSSKTHNTKNVEHQETNPDI